MSDDSRFMTMSGIKAEHFNDSSSGQADEIVTLLYIYLNVLSSNFTKIVKKANQSLFSSHPATTVKKYRRPIQGERKKLQATVHNGRSQIDSSLKSTRRPA